MVSVISIVPLFSTGRHPLPVQVPGTQPLYALDMFKAFLVGQL